MGRPIAFEVTPITTGPKNHLFGYIGQSLTIPWNESGRYIGCPGRVRPQTS